MTAKKALITYIKYNDRYFHNLYIDDYPYEILLALKKIIESNLNGLPKGYRLYSNGYEEKLMGMEILKENETKTQF